MVSTPDRTLNGRVAFGGGASRNLGGLRKSGSRAPAGLSADQRHHSSSPRILTRPTLAATVMLISWLRKVVTV